LSKKKVMLGMSGGVDSSVAAALLLEQGYDVIGATMQIWPDKPENTKCPEGTCCSDSAVYDARRVADKLNIPFYVLNFKDVFKENVIEYFNSEYFKGRTPNPCIACNRYIKFGKMLDKALSMDIDYIATGHYARIKHNSDTGRYILYKSHTEKKDQTYVLYNLTQYQLSKTLFPIGDYSKDKVREKAKELGLSVSSKPDSQEICFVEDDDYGRYVSENTDREVIPGDFINAYGKKLGTHKGIIYYTIGQRKGLGITFGKPMFVTAIDSVKNTVTLGEASDVFSDTLVASDLNFISIENLTDKMNIKAKIRYSANEADAVIKPLDNTTVEVKFNEPQRAITPGQSVVFYDGDSVVGGGVIIK